MPKALLCVKSLATVTVAARCPSPTRPLAPLAAPPAPTNTTGAPTDRNRQPISTHQKQARRTHAHHQPTPPHIL
ncbi:hypothetical protein FB107DRAFT_255285, partial [Schizophyllum commune]